MSVVHIKNGDLEPPVTANLMQAVGTAAQTAINLTTATSVRFIMRNKSTGTVKVDHVATIVTPLTGSVRYDWISGDTDTDGIYDENWKIIWPTARPQTVPGSGYDTIHIGDDLAT